MTPLDFAAALMAYCAWSRGSVTSWGRSPSRNAKVGGVQKSLHQIWLAADVGYAPEPVPPLASAREMARRLGIRLIRESDHDHLQAM